MSPLGEGASIVGATRYRGRICETDNGRLYNTRWYRNRRTRRLWEQQIIELRDRCGTIVIELFSDTEMFMASPPKKV
jgi:hypothetical protein